MRRFATVVAGLVMLLLTVFLIGEAGAQTSAKAAAAKSAPAKAEAVPAQPVKSTGSRTAPITMEVWSDFQCPACRNLYAESVKPLMNDYVHTGKVYFIHRDMPLAMHAHARDAARYANAAAQINKFEKVAEVLYATQDAWAMDGTRLETIVATVLTPAEMKQVRQNLRSKTVEDAIDSDMARGRQHRVGSTPTVVLTHRGRSMPLPGVVSYPLLRRVLDQMLAQQ